MARKKDKAVEDFKPRTLTAKTHNQKEYIRNIVEATVNFVVGPAGTGKTHVAVGMAVQMLAREDIERIIISRPLVGVGKDMGYLPGDVGEKVGPYVQPCFDELNYYLSLSAIKQYVHAKKIEIVPLSMMRGRTFNDAFVILDEAQNATRSELKTCLTRLGHGSKLVIAGDPIQTDLPDYDSGAFLDAISRLRDVDQVAISELGYADIVRHSILSDILRRLW